MTERDRQKARYQAYQRVAAALFAAPGYIKIPEGATVWMTEDGAFVEAVVWVPSKEIEQYVGQTEASGNAGGAGSGSGAPTAPGAGRRSEP